MISNFFLPLTPSLTFLPVNGIIEVHPDGAGVHDGDEKQMKSYTEICGGQVAHEELGDRETKV